MGTIASVFATTLHDNASLLMALMIFLAAGTMAFSVMAFARVRGAIKKRTSRLVDEDELQSNPRRSLRYSSLQAVTRLIEYTTRHYSETNDDHMKVLRRRLVQAGIYDQRAVAFFFIARTALALGLAALLFAMRPMIGPHSPTFFWLIVIVGGIAGYVGPSMYIDRRISANKLEH